MSEKRVFYCKKCGGTFLSWVKPTKCFYKSGKNVCSGDAFSRILTEDDEMNENEKVIVQEAMMKYGGGVC